MSETTSALGSKRPFAAVQPKEAGWTSAPGSKLSFDKIGRMTASTRFHLTLPTPELAEKVKSVIKDE